MWDCLNLVQMLKFLYPEYVLLIVVSIHGIKLQIMIQVVNFVLLSSWLLLSQGCERESTGPLDLEINLLFDIVYRIQILFSIVYVFIFLLWILFMFEHLIYLFYRMQKKYAYLLKWRIATILEEGGGLRKFTKYLSDNSGAKGYCMYASLKTL